MKKYAVIAVLAGSCLVAFTQDQKPSNLSTNVQAQSKKLQSIFFEFKGGSLREFLMAIKEEYGVDYLEIATIPEFALEKVKVPKMKLQTSASGILIIYNNLSSAGVKGLGKWVSNVLSHDFLPNTLVYLPPDDADLGPRVRVFPLNRKQAEERDNLQEAVELAIRAYSDSSKIHTTGNLHFHPRTKLLIAVGDEPYINIVSEVVNGFKEASTYLPGPFLPHDNKQPEQQKGQ